MNEITYDHTTASSYDAIKLNGKSLDFNSIEVNNKIIPNEHDFEIVKKAIPNGVGFFSDVVEEVAKENCTDIEKCFIAFRCGFITCEKSSRLRSNLIDFVLQHKDPTMSQSVERLVREETPPDLDDNCKYLMPFFTLGVCVNIQQRAKDRLREMKIEGRDKDLKKFLKDFTSGHFSKDEG